MSTKQKKRQLSAFEEEILKSYKKVMEYKVICEANIVSLLWKNTELFHTYSLVLEDFTENMWKVFWQIAYDIVVKEGKELDEITTEFYLEKHPKLKAKYDNYGGYEKIIATSEYVKESNMLPEKTKLKELNNHLENLFEILAKLEKNNETENSLLKKTNIQFNSDLFAQLKQDLIPALDIGDLININKYWDKMKELLLCLSSQKERIKEIDNAIDNYSFDTVTDLLELIDTKK